LDLELGVFVPVSQIDGGDSGTGSVEDIEVVGEPALLYGPEHLRATPLGNLRPHYVAGRVTATAPLEDRHDRRPRSLEIIRVLGREEPLVGRTGRNSSQRNIYIKIGI
jgi:hypothetical protein